jgi:hypothetical protein
MEVPGCHPNSGNSEKQPSEPPTVPVFELIKTDSLGYGEGKMIFVLSSAEFFYQMQRSTCTNLQSQRMKQKKDLK